MAPVKVLGSAAFTNVARVLVCLEEVGAEYEIVDVDFRSKEHKGPTTSPETRSARSRRSRTGISRSSVSFQFPIDFQIPILRTDFEITELYMHLRLLRVPRDLTLRAPQAHDRRGQPAEGRRPQGVGPRRRLAGRGGPQLRPRHALGVLPAPRRAGAGRGARREDHRRERREAEEGAGRVRGPAEQAQVPGRGFPEPRGPQPLP
uniref:GST N-terminal domain-containing protein n=1 Tax=Aegilops tauschii subsp. strangulata TaxID=200361 RepID=A0A453M1I7_AEGTS